MTSCIWMTCNTDRSLPPQLSTPDKVPIPERYLDTDPDLPLSPDEIREKKKKVQRIKTLIAKSKYAALSTQTASCSLCYHLFCTYVYS